MFFRVPIRLLVILPRITPFRSDRLPHIPYRWNSSKIPNDNQKVGEKSAENPSRSDPTTFPAVKPKFKLEDKDLAEEFIRGSGPGGQAINKTSNCVRLTHIPTGIHVVCQQTRSLQLNRHIARNWLTERVELHLHGMQSKAGRRIEKAKKSKAKMAKRAKEKLAGDGEATVPVPAREKKWERLQRQLSVHLREEQKPHK